MNINSRKYCDLFIIYFEMVIKVGINGFGRIGRVIFRTCLETTDLEVRAINDPAIDIAYICYLIKFDSTHGKLKCDVTFVDDEITINGNKVKVYREQIPLNIPWYIESVQYVVEASGMFTNYDKASGHLTSQSVKRVLVTAPSVDVPMLIIGVNEDRIKKDQKVISCASSTLYCLAPIIKILEDNFRVTEGFITSIHAMTPSLKPLDGLCLRGKHWRDHRSIHQNIIPAATGACRALGKIIPRVKDKLTGMAFRVPVVNVSVLDITVRLNKNTSIEDIVRCIDDEGRSSMKRVIKTSSDDAVSSDFLGEENSCILDVNSCLQLTPNFFKLICWYENEYSYACRVIDSIKLLDKISQLDLASRTKYAKTATSGRLANERQIPYYNRNMYCNTLIRNTSRLFSLSQNNGFKEKLSQRHVYNRQPLVLHNSVPNQSICDSKHGNGFFKMWMNDERITNTKQNRPSFFQSCLALKPSYNESSNYLKTRERLEEVKKEFSKMVFMTENLLKISKGSNLDNNVISKEESAGRKGSEHDYINERYLEKSEDVVSNIMVSDNHQNEAFKSQNRADKSYNIEECNNDKSISIECSDDLQSVPGDNNSYNQVKADKTSDNLIFENNESLNKLENHSEDLKQNEEVTKQRGFCIKNDSYHDVEHIRSNIDTSIVTNENANIIRCTKINSIVSKNETEIRETYSDLGKAVRDTNVMENKVDSRESLNRIPNIKKKIIEGLIKKLSIETSVETYCPDPIKSKTTVSNDAGNNLIDIYDKLDSASATDSENSFQMHERKSQVIKITDLTNSVEDLARLDKICRIIEISDELSDKLFSALDNSNEDYKRKKWSFKDLCENIKLDKFCNEVFGSTTGN